MSRKVENWVSINETTKDKQFRQCHALGLGEELGFSKGLLGGLHGSQKLQQVSSKIATNVFHSVVLQSPGTGTGSSLHSGYKLHCSYRGWVYTGSLAS